MKFIKPKNINKQRVEFSISSKTKLLIEGYSKYTGYDEGEVLDLFLDNLMNDDEFVSWIDKQRFNKKLKMLIAPIDEGGEAIDV